MRAAGLHTALWRLPAMVQSCMVSPIRTAGHPTRFIPPSTHETPKKRPPPSLPACPWLLQMGATRGRGPGLVIRPVLALALVLLVAAAAAAPVKHNKPKHKHKPAKGQVVVRARCGIKAGGRPCANPRLCCSKDVGAPAAGRPARPACQGCASRALRAVRCALPPSHPPVSHGLQGFCGANKAFCGKDVCVSGPCRREVTPVTPPKPHPAGPAAPSPQVPSPSPTVPSPSPEPSPSPADPVPPTTTGAPDAEPLPAFPAELGDAATQYSWLWGREGELWSPAGRLADWSYAGYAGEQGRLQLVGADGAAHPSPPFGVCLVLPALQPTQPPCARPPPTCPAGEREIPGPEAFPSQFNVRDYGARGDGVVGER